MAHGHAASGGDFRRDLGAGQHAAVARLGALAHFEFDQLDLRVARVGRKTLFAETAVLVAAAEIARADFPDQVAAVDAVVLRDRTFARVVRKAAHFCALIERHDGVGRERAKTHRRNVKHAGLVRLGAGLARPVGLAGRAANPQAKVVRRQRRRCHRVVDPLVALAAHVELCAERAVVRLALGALVHQRALGAGKRQRLAVAFDEILAHLGPDEFEQKTQVPDHRVIAQHRVARLAQIVQAQRHQRRAKHQRQQPVQAKQHQIDQRQQRAKQAQPQGGVAKRRPGRQRRKSQAHKVVSRAKG